MGASQRAIQVSFALNASLIIAIFAVSGNTSYLQSAANGVFPFVADESLRLWLFDGLIVVTALFISMLAIWGIGRSAVAELND